MNKIFNKKNSFIALFISLIITNIMVIINILKLNIIPIKYIILMIIIIILVNLIIYTVYRLPKKVFKIISIILITIFLILNIVITYYMNTTNTFLNKSFNNSENEYTNIFHIVTLSDSNKTMDELDYLGYYKDNVNIEKALSKINFNNNISYDDIFNMFDSLGESINCILIEDSLYNLIFEMNSEYNKENYKIIYTFDITITEENIDNQSNNNDIVNIYIGGTDFTNVYYDFNMVVSINQKTHKILLTSIPRDYYINVSGKNKKDILGYHGVWGINTSKKSVEELLDIDINYYIKINTNSLVGLVDTIDGIEYCSNKSFTTTHALVLNTYNDSGKHLYVPAKCKKYTGIEILTIARERLAFAGGDRQRQKNCQQIMISLFKKIASLNSLKDYNKILDSISSLYNTNIDRNLITDFIKNIINNGNIYSFETQSLNGSDSINYVHLSNIKDYIMIPNNSSIENAKKKLKEFI